MFNQVTLIGYLGKDPEVRFTGGGHAVCKFSLATSERWTDNDGKAQEKTEWHNIIAWRKLGEICGKHLSKGRLVTIIGKIAYRTYDNKEGVKIYVTDIIADKVIFMPNANKDGSQSQDRDRGDRERSGNDRGGSRRSDGDPEWNEPPAGGGGGGGGGHDDDDLPFITDAIIPRDRRRI